MSMPCPHEKRHVYDRGRMGAAATSTVTPRGRLRLWAAGAGGIESAIDSKIVGNGMREWGNGEGEEDEDEDEGEERGGSGRY